MTAGRGRVDPDLAAGGLLAVLVLAVFAPGWARGLSPFWGDLTYIHHPWRALDAELLAAGRLPLWNPYVYFGMPQAATMQDALFYPGGVPFPLFGFAAATAIFQAFHYWLAAALSYLWLRSLGLRRAAGLGGALVFALGGVLFSRLPFLNHLAVLSLVPALCLFFDRPVLLATALCLAFLAGYPPFLVGSSLAAWGLCVVLAARRGRGARLAACARGWAAAGALAAGLSACLLLPALELVWTSRRAGGVPLAEALNFGWAPRDLLQWLSPALVSWTRFNPAVEWWKCAYLGLAGAFAACWGLGRLARPKALAFLAAWGGLGLLMLGSSNSVSAALWERLPGLRLVRYPGNLAYLAMPSTALAAAAGFEKMRGRRWLLAALALELCAYAWGAVPWAPRALFTTAGPLVRFLQEEAGGDRYLLSPRALESSSGAGVLDWKERLYGLTNAPFKLRSAGNFGDPLVPRPSYEFMDALLSAPSAERAAELFPWADIRFLLTPDEPPRPRGLRPEGRRLWAVSRLEQPVSLAYLFDEKSGAALPAGLPELVPAAGRRAEWRSSREDRLEVSGDAGPGWAFVSQPLYPGWRVRLDAPAGSAWLEPSPALGAFQKLPVPSGPWTLRFFYDPFSWRLGRLASVLCLMGLALYCYNRLLRASDEE